MEHMPTRSGVRLTGDDFQHVFTWLKALRCLVSNGDVASVSFEVREAGNVDDIVVEYRAGARTYHQVKFATDQRTPLRHDWFTTPANPRGASPLQRFHESFRQLGAPDMFLETNRAIDANDPLLGHVGGIDDRLVPRAFAPGPQTTTGQIRAAWASHLSIGEAELRELLSHLRIRAGAGSLRTIQESCQDLMAALGLRSDQSAMYIGAGALREMIETGRHTLDAEGVRALVDSLGLRASEPAASMLLQCLEPNPMADEATVARDWSGLFEQPHWRQLRDPADWEGRVRSELGDAVASIRAQGFHRVLVSGTYRLSVALLAGFAMRGVSGMQVGRRQPPDDEWWSDGPRTPMAVDRQVATLGNGTEVAVALAIAADLAADVEQFCRRQLPAVGTLVTLTPPGGPGRQAIPDAAAARGLADALLAELRDVGRDTERLHLFQAVPAGLSLLLGHAWNRVRETQLYDDTNPGYAPTFALVS
ncbi:MAG TPA: SAVED domain-containing protein [Baekduia sp.]|nr:SAVED domain-containing protein [Baekduia sp.]